jgi:hypothetical protein
MCLNEACIKVFIGKNLVYAFTIQNGLKQGDALSPLLFNLAVDSSIRIVHKNLEGLELNETHKLMVCVDSVNILGEDVNTVRKHRSSIRG